MISLFPTVMMWWSLKVLLNFDADWGLLFFLVWLIVMIVVLFEFPIPKTIKEKVKKKIYKV